MSKRADFYIISVADIALVAIVIVLCLFYIFRGHWQQAGKGLSVDKAMVYLGGKLLTEIDVSKDNIISLLSGKMQIEVKNRRICVINSDCPKHICINSGWIKYPGEIIVCAANRIIIELKAPQEAFLDAVVY